MKLLLVINEMLEHERAVTPCTRKGNMCSRLENILNENPNADTKV